MTRRKSSSDHPGRAVLGPNTGEAKVKKPAEKNPPKKKKKLTYLERIAECDVSEELRVSISLALKKLETSEDMKELELPSSLSSEERKYVHIVSQQMGFKSKSRGSGGHRYVTVYKKQQSSIVRQEAVLRLSDVAVAAVAALLQRCPVTARERQDLLPPTDRDRLLSADLRELGLLRSLGRLTPGPPQVPPPPAPSEVASEAKRLPIWSQHSHILDAIARHQVVLVCGETGSGKTTQVPQMLLDEATQHCRPVRVLCTQPRRISAVTIAERVAMERGERLGYTVGYQIRLESKLCSKTLLTFCTNGVLLRTLMAGESALATITHVVVDEVHERDRFTDFLLTVLKDSLPKFQHLKLVLMSAAMDIELYSKYFGSCPIIDVPGQCFPVTEYFLEDVLKLTNYKSKAMNLALKKIESRQKHSPSHDWTATLKKALGIAEASEDSPAQPPAAGGADAAPTAASASDDAQATPPSEASPSSHSKSSSSNATKDEQGSTAPYCDDSDDAIIEEEELIPHAEMDSVLEAAFLQDSDEAFARMLCLIMAEGISPNYQHTVTQATPLMVAAGRGRVSVMEQLLSLGASVGLRSADNRTAVAWAADTQQQQAVHLLCCYGASDDEAERAANGPAAAQQADVPPAPPLTEEDKKRLEAYLMAASDELADVDLICQLCLKVHASEPPGAILVFLPGYDSIVAARDCIMAQEPRFAQAGLRIMVFCLHSSMQSADQKRVFRPVPRGFRKVVLATNIAETSITIDDVVYVINSGKVKEVSFDTISGASCLREVWASRASALQRRGRAGRCRPGIVYHLLSRARYASLPPYQLPEILRVPLQELCLQTKLLAPSNVPIADFLTRAPEPPSLMVVRSAVHLLKSMEAIDGWEEVTALGHHLLELPLPPALGKMVLVATVLKCLDPILTLAACLAHKDPFILPKNPEDRTLCNKVKKNLAGNLYSDHLILIRSFMLWQKAQNEGWEKKWCQRHYVSSAGMEMISGIRVQVLAQLRGMGFVKSRGSQPDLKDANLNSENFGAVKAAIVAGMYPNLIRVDRELLTLRTQKQSQVRLHSSSCIYDMSTSAAGAVQVPSIARLAKKEVIKALPTDWLVFEEIIMTGTLASARSVTAVSPMCVLLMAGPTRLPLHAITTAAGDDHSDSDTEQQPLAGYARLRLDDWVQFVGLPDHLQAALQLRHKLHSIILRRLKSPSKGVYPGDDDVIRTVATVLGREEVAMGFVDPVTCAPEQVTGIGTSSPKFRSPATRSNGSNGPSSAKPNSAKSAKNNANKTGQAGSPSNKATTTGVKTPRQGGNAAETQTSKAKSHADDAGEGQRSRSDRAAAAASPAGRNRKDEAVDRAAGALQALAVADSPRQESSKKGKSFYLIRCAGARPLELALQSGTWNFGDPALENKLQLAAQRGRVHLVFCHTLSSQLQACAVLGKKVGGAGGDASSVYQLEWVAKSALPLHVTRPLHNACSDNQPVLATRSGQEIDGECGQRLLEGWRLQSGSQEAAVSKPQSQQHHRQQQQYRQQHRQMHHHGYQGNQGFYRNAGQNLHGNLRFQTPPYFDLGQDAPGQRFRPGAGPMPKSFYRAPGGGRR